MLGIYGSPDEDTTGFFKYRSRSGLSAFFLVHLSARMRNRNHGQARNRANREGAGRGETEHDNGRVCNSQDMIVFGRWEADTAVRRDMAVCESVVGRKRG